MILFGRERRRLPRRIERVMRWTEAVFLGGLVTVATLFGLLVLYLVKSALGIDLIPGYSLGIWSWFKAGVWRVRWEPLVGRLQRELGEELIGVWLYGSYASGDERADSNIDLAILTRRPLTLERLHELAFELAKIAGRDVDLVDLRRAPTVLGMQIISTGRRLFCRDMFICEQLESQIFSDYVDLNERRSGILQDIRERGSVYG